MTSRAAGINLARSIALAVLHDEHGYVGYSGPAGDPSAALLATGKTVIVECARVDTRTSPTRFAVERAVLDVHLDSPVPVYVAIPQLAESGEIAVGLCPAERLARHYTNGTEVETFAVGPWQRFWQAQSILAPATAPPAHLASAVELKPDDLADPHLATRLSADEPHCDAEEPMPAHHLVGVDGSDKKYLPWVWQVPHPERPLFHYAWTSDGYRLTETESMRERLREHLRRVEEARSQSDGVTLVVTRPWRTLRPLSRRLLVTLLLARIETTAASDWASPIMESEDETDARGDGEE
ncbi:hypothetical protein JL108_08705 [Aeromicrobium sp. YIM 150415]|uniref:hypothetical protein n=1 Tax=Aeromicrobium sp. YIM 150415 TaxID=2803912 RepID=UPI0019633230|nr:hypothetical protein [Aeromicrobium sp. YIM 150415]MBM9463530.1 hypothetical protein [Aeromicrobium sp. YIM 150415]